MADESKINKIVRLSKLPLQIRNVSTSAHIHHGKTALTDNLLAASGYMAEKSAGDLEKGMMTWQHSDEQERLLTVDAANVAMVHNFDKKEYLINLIDTPGHVDFSGNVTRAMRAIDGTIVLVCASEGIMPQTETVLKQALRERVKPVLFINKIDRLIKELKLSPEKIQEQIIKIIDDFNRLVEDIAEEEFRQKWKVNVMDGSVAFGSARDNWALSFSYMKKKNISFKDIINMYSLNEAERLKWCWENAPLFEVILDMAIKHLPNPLEAQKYRVPRIWKGDADSEFGKDLYTCNPKGKIAFVITRVVIDPVSGSELSVGRLFSGTVEKGMNVYLNNAKQYQRVQQVMVYNGIKAEAVGSMTAGNVIALAGIVGYAGETVTQEPEQAFTELKHIFEPVITKAIEAKRPADLPKLIEVLKKVAKEDPSIKIEINEETGENLMHGMGELHLEIIENRIKTEKNVEVVTSQPIVVYRETVQKPSNEFQGRSPNKHNVFYMIVEPLEEAVYNSIKAGELTEMRIKKKNEQLWNQLSKLGISNEEARQYRQIYRDCVLLDKTRGIVHIGEIIEMIMDGFEQVIDAGILAKEPCTRLKVSIMDCKLHEDAIHRGPAQVYPAIRDAMRDCIADAKPVLYEPLQVLLFEAPMSYFGDVTKFVQSKRGQLLEVNQEREYLSAKVKMPVAEMIGLAGDLRSLTEGRGTFYIIDQLFAKIPNEIQDKTIRKIRERKGLANDAAGMIKI